MANEIQTYRVRVEKTVEQIYDVSAGSEDAALEKVRTGEVQPLYRRVADHREAFVKKPDPRLDE